MNTKNNVFQECSSSLTISTKTSASFSAIACGYRLQKAASDPTDFQSNTRKASAVEGLDRCLSLISILGSRVDKVSSSLRKMPGTCKQCHGQTGSEHQGSRWGFDQCTLPHSDDCPGGIVETPGVRKACPIG